jgi:hypothetical protein
MKKSIILLALIPFSVFAQNTNNLDTAWVNSYGGPNIDIGRDVKETQDKGFIISGVSSTFGSGNSSFYIIKTDSLGVHKWSKTIGTSNNDYCYSVEIANDGGYYFSGTSNNNLQTGYDGVLVKTDNLGNVLWSKYYGGGDWDFIYSSCIMPDGGLILCGETNSDSKGASDAYIIRTNSSGDTLWTKKLGTAGGDALYSVVQKNNRIYTAGKVFNPNRNKNLACIYKLSFDGDVLAHDYFTADSTEDYMYKSLFITSNDEILLCGKSNSTELGHPIILKVDTTNLNHLIYQTDTQNFHHQCILEGYYNDIYALGYSTGGLGGLGASFVRYDQNLTYLLGANFGGDKDEVAFKMIKTSRGFAIVGSTNSYGNPSGSIDENVYLVVFNKKALESEYFILLNEFQDNLSPVGLNKNSTNNYKLILYPNPVNSVYTIRFPDSNFNGKTVKYQLFDNKGIIVYESIIDVSQDRLILDRKGISSGIYYYKLSENNSTVSSGKIAFE